jgi:tripartite-type tricarboxylate transporter receptor subunit TctC
MGSLTWSTAREHVASGTLVAVAISSPERVTGFPQIPTFKEMGYPDVTTTVWLSVSGPRGMPADVVQKLNTAVNAAIQDPRIRAHLDQDAFDMRLLTPEQTTALFKQEYEKWTPAIKAALSGKD